MIVDSEDEDPGQGFGRATLSADLLHFHQSPDRRAVDADRLARNCSDAQLGLEECGQELSQWRTADGRCNNLKRPRWGTSHSPYRRLLPPAYADSHLHFRLSVAGSELPSARTVSDKLTGRRKPDTGTEMTGHAMQWGQFLTHDMDHTPEVAAPHLTDCCGKDKHHPACAPVHISPSDSLYSKHNKTCINFLRSALAPAIACTTVDQQNQVTSYIDGSMVYGSNQETLQALRQYQGGRLKVSQGKESRVSAQAWADPADHCRLSAGGGQWWRVSAGRGTLFPLRGQESQ